ENVRLNGRLSFIKKVILSMILTVILVILLCLLLTGNIEKVFILEKLLIIFMTELVIVFLGIIFGNLLWNKYERIYKENIELHKNK
ncbi:MAG: hypothetical protein ACRC92_16215, partial [Peptostreptococcaceae bacterium]